MNKKQKREKEKMMIVADQTNDRIIIIYVCKKMLPKKLATSFISWFKNYPDTTLQDRFPYQQDYL